MKFVIYADDTQFCFPIENIDDAKKKVKEIMDDVRKWMAGKRLKLNEGKTECMLFGTANSLKNYEGFKTVSIGNNEVKLVRVVKNLGVLMDSGLTMKDQILNTVKVCNYHIRNIAFIRKYLDEDTLSMVVCNHVISRLDYCNSLYYGLPNYLLKKLQNVQNRAARLIKKIKLRDRITPALMDLHWLPIKARIEFKICVLTYKSLKYSEPKYLYDHLKPYELHTPMNLRHSDDKHRLQLPRTYNKIGDRSFSSCAPKLYNKLSVQLKDIDSVKSFKKKLKTFLYERCYDNCDKKIKDQYRL